MTIYDSINLINFAEDRLEAFVPVREISVEYCWSVVRGFYHAVTGAPVDFFSCPDVHPEVLLEFSSHLSLLRNDYSWEVHLATELGWFKYWGYHQLTPQQELVNHIVQVDVVLEFEHQGPDQREAGLVGLLHQKGTMLWTSLYRYSPSSLYV